MLIVILKDGSYLRLENDPETKEWRTFNRDKATRFYNFTEAQLNANMCHLRDYKIENFFLKSS